MSFYLKVIGVSLVFALLCAASIVSFRMGNKFKQAEWDAAVLAGKQAQEKALQAAAAEVAKIDVKQQTIVQKVTRETIEKPVFRDCRSGPDAVGLLNAAAGHEQDQPAGRGELPASAASR